MPHEQRAHCEAIHCAFHNEDEPTESTLSITCNECFHTFTDPTDLVLADNAKRAELQMGPRPEEHARLIADALDRDRYAILDHITACPFCAHSF